MSITTFAELKTALANWTARDTETTYLPDFITAAEQMHAWGFQGNQFQIPALRLQAMETITDLTIDAQREDLPTGYLEGIRLYLDTDPLRPVEFISRSDFYTRYMSTVTGKPLAFTIEDDDLVFGPSPDATYTGKFLYYKKFDALSDSTTTNWLLTNAPFLYLYGAMIHYSLFNMFDDRAMMFANLYSGLANGLSGADNRGAHSGSVLQIRAG
jgi:hypothetical protein